MVINFPWVLAAALYPWELALCLCVCMCMWVCACLCMLIISGVLFSGLSGRAWVNFLIYSLSGQHSMVLSHMTGNGVRVCVCKLMTNININIPDALKMVQEHPSIPWFCWVLNDWVVLLAKIQLHFIFPRPHVTLCLVCSSHFLFVLPAAFLQSETTWNSSFSKLFDKLAFPCSRANSSTNPLLASTATAMCWVLNKWQPPEGTLLPSSATTVQPAQNWTTQYAAGINSITTATHQQMMCRLVPSM